MTTERERIDDINKGSQCWKIYGHTGKIKRITEGVENLRKRRGRKEIFSQKSWKSLLSLESR